MTFSTNLNYVFLRTSFKKTNKIAENNDAVQIVLKALFWTIDLNALTNQDIASLVLFKYRWWTGVAVTESFNYPIITVWWQWRLTCKWENYCMLVISGKVFWKCKQNKKAFFSNVQLKLWHLSLKTRRVSVWLAPSCFIFSCFLNYWLVSYI